MYLKKNINYNYLFNLFFVLLPFSFIIGSTIINLNIVLILLFGFLAIKKNNLYIKFKYTNILLILFFLNLFISSIYNHEYQSQESIIKLFLFSRFLFLYLIIEILIENKILKLNNFCKMSLVCVSFVCCDVLIQYFFGANIFGFKSLNNILYPGIFNQEPISGAYAQKFLLFSIISLLFFKNITLKNTLIIFCVTFFLFAIFISGNRMPLILSVGSIILLIFFNSKLRLNLIVSIFIFLILGSAVIKNDKLISQRYYNFYAKIFQPNLPWITSETIKKIDSFTTTKNNGVVSKKIEKLNFFSEQNSSQHGLIFIHTFNSFLENKIIGKGYKSSRRYCKAPPTGKMCIPHPHNYHLEILHDSGLTGYFFIILFLILTLIQTIKNIINENNSLNKSITLTILIYLLMEFWPIRSAGSLYTTWNGSALWVGISLSNVGLKRFSN